jgi:tetratricopeptide (TPR) repeat protein
MHPRLGAILLLCFSVQLWAKPNTNFWRRPRSRRHRDTTVLPVTTKSAKARALYEQAMTDYENLRMAQAMEGWRRAAKADLNFASAHIMLSFNSKDPAEQSSELAKAKVLRNRVSPGEQLLIHWVEGVRENNYLSGIQAMNDLVSDYPKDKRLLYLVGNWLVLQESYDQALRFMQRALAIDPRYPPALNDLGYCYAFLRDYKNAMEAMERYVASLPGEPNPNDSYAEILRLSGDFEGALQHYRAALKIDSHFVFSQLGIGDTYALMGDPERARAEYAKAITQAESEADRVEFSMQAALTWVRERKYREADAAFSSVAAEAHAAGLAFHEAEIHRMMAQYQPDPGNGLKHLQQAESVLSGARNIPKSDHDEEQARVLRWRVARALDADDEKTAQRALQQLEDMVSTSRSHIIGHSYHAAYGVFLMAQQKYGEAIEHLEEDHDNPFSIRLLAEAFTRTGATAEARDLMKRITTTNTPTIEQALVVLPARARVASNSH